MRHKNSGRKFDRNTSSRRAMLRNLTANLVLHERIETTDAKAKELRRVAERLITKAHPPRRGRVHARRTKLSADGQGAPPPRAAPRRGVHPALRRADRRRAATTKKVDLVEKVFLDLAKRFEGRAGRLHAHRQVRPAPRRQRADLDHRVRRRPGGGEGCPGGGCEACEEEQDVQDRDRRSAGCRREGRVGLNKKTRLRACPSREAPAPPQGRAGKLLVRLAPWSSRWSERSLGA